MCRGCLKHLEFWKCSRRRITRLVRRSPSARTVQCCAPSSRSLSSPAMPRHSSLVLLLILLSRRLGPGIAARGSVLMARRVLMDGG